MTIDIKYIKYIVKYLILPFILWLSIFGLSKISEDANPVDYFALVSIAKMTLVFMFGYIIRVSTIGRIKWDEVNHNYKAVTYSAMLIATAIVLN